MNVGGLPQRIARLAATLGAAALLASCLAGGPDGPPPQEEPAELAVGHSVDITMNTDGAERTLSVSVDRAVPGQASDLDELAEPEKHAGTIPWYVVYTQVPRDEPGIFMINFTATTAEGRPVTELNVVMGSIGECADPAYRVEGGRESPVGKPVSQCRIFLVPEGDTLGRLTPREGDPTPTWVVEWPPGLG